MDSTGSLVSLLVIMFYVLWIGGGIYMLVTLQSLRQENVRMRARLEELEERMNRLTGGNPGYRPQ